LDAGDAGTPTAQALVPEDEKTPRGNEQKRTKRRSSSTGPKQATLDIFSTKPDTHNDIAESKPTDGLNSHNIVNLTADTLEGDLNYGRRKRQRTGSPRADAADEDMAGHCKSIPEVRDDSGLGTMSSWDAQLRVKAEKLVEAESDAGDIREESGKMTPAMPNKSMLVARQDPAAQLLEEVEALDQARRSSTPRSIFEGTEWTSKMPKPPSDGASKPSSK
jgi:hypothetical protein